MKTINSWGKPFTILALGLSIVGYLNAPSTAVTDTTTANVAQKPELEFIRVSGQHSTRAIGS
jgi:hypothetical protein